MRTITPALITLIMLIVIGALIMLYIGKSFFFRDAPEEAPPATRNVPMASANIPAGTLITSEHLILGPMKVADMSRETILNDDKIIGRYALKDLEQAQSIETSDLYPPNERPPLELAPGTHAITIGLGDSTSIVDGLIKPGDYVDVHLTLADNGADRRFRGGFTMTMFKGVRVVGMNRLTQRTDISRGSNTVTFELTPEQSNILLEAKEHGEISISYNPNGKGTGGVDVADSDRAYFEEILGLPEIPEPEKPFLTELYRGTNRSLIGYDDEWNDGRDWGYDYDRNRATPWIEQPGWAPPRGGGYGGRGGYGGAYRGYGGGQGYGGGYRGTSNDAGPQPGNVNPNGGPELNPAQPRSNGRPNFAS